MRSWSARRLRRGHANICGGQEQTRVGAREKKKAPGSCELRALLRGEPSSPCARHGRRHITGHRRTLRSDNATYARALDRAHSLIRLRDETGIASDRFKAGNDRNASPGELDFMYRGMTRGMKAHVSTMLTESGLSIPLPVRDFKAPVRPKAGCKPTSTAFRVLFVLTVPHP